MTKDEAFLKISSKLFIGINLLLSREFLMLSII